MSLMNKIKRLDRLFRVYGRNFLTVSNQIADTKILAAKVMLNQLADKGVIGNIRDAEFKVFSQFCEDGIIQYLIRQVGNLDRSTFIEFGVENYEEANTRFLLVNNNWSGLILDSSPRNIAHVRDTQLFWNHNLTAVASFIDAENIDSLIVQNGFAGREIGLLSIDIDGNDYWVWREISVIEPVIVIIEFNSVFGSLHAITVPYDPKFIRSQAHSSCLYFGASLKALELLGKCKGYALVGCNSAGNNAFFVRQDRLNGLPVLSTKDAYVESQFRESRDEYGNPTFIAGAARLEQIKNMPVYDVERNVILKISELALV